MTEFWVSQGNKWCDFCKIYISNNPVSIRNHELGQRHKDNVAKKLNNMRQEKVAKEKEQKETARVLEQIESKAKRSYQKDLARFQEARDYNAQALVSEGNGQVNGSTSGEWQFETSSGYYYNQASNCYYDPKSGFYYTEALGKWVTQEEALAASQVSLESVQKKPSLGKPPSTSEKDTKSAGTSQSGPPPGRVVSAPLNPTRPIKGTPSNLTVNKRKRPGEKPKAVSEAEAVALKAREAARKRVEEREKPLLGLYKH